MIVVTEDTDVIILCAAFKHEMNCNIFIRCGSSTRTRLIDMKKVASALGTNVCKALMGLHAYTLDVSQ